MMYVVENRAFSQRALRICHNPVEMALERALEDAFGRRFGIKIVSYIARPAHAVVLGCAPWRAARRWSRLAADAIVTLDSVR